MTAEKDKRAFPMPLAVGPAGDLYDASQTDPGMSLLDYFAAHAMGALILKYPKHDFDDVATEAVGHAYAMIAALSSKGDR